jgi:hypothetical protein
LMVWSRSQSAAGMRHPGKTQLGERACTARRRVVVGLLRVVPFHSTDPWSGWVMVTRHCEPGWLVGDLAGDVGDHWSVPVEFPWGVGESHQGGEVDGDLHCPGTGPLPGCSPAQQVQGDVHPELVDAAGIPFPFPRIGELVDVSHGGYRFVGG